jgi:hypothetical protein
LLSSHHQLTTTNPFPRLCSLIVYYPDPLYPSKDDDGAAAAAAAAATATAPGVPPPCANISSTASSSSIASSSYSAASILPIQIHLAATQPLSLCDSYTTATTTTTTTTTTNSSYKAHTPRKRHRCHAFFYPESRAGFAEPRNPNYDVVSARLAWSRTLDCLRQGFSGASPAWRVTEIEATWEEYWRGVLHGNVDQVMRVMVPEEDLGQDEHQDYHPREIGGDRRDREDLGLGPAREDRCADAGPVVNCVPTMVGGEFLPLPLSCYI